MIDPSFFAGALQSKDPELFASISAELHRQQNNIELIASENIVSRAVLEAQGSILTNKYAEGYPGKRYYGGCEKVDLAESLAIERACKLFGCSYANVQPHSGAQANEAVFLALLQPGDVFMGLAMAAGGHLTHGASVSMSGKWFKAVPYGVRAEDGRIDMEEVARLAHESKPKMIITGGSAYPREIDFAAFRKIADDVGALLMVDMAHFAGLVAGGVYPSPIPHAHIVTTTTHKTLRGPRGGMILTNDEALAKKINSAVFPGLQGGPLMHVIAAKAVMLGEALQPSFKDYAKNVVDNAKGSLPDNTLAWLDRDLASHPKGKDGIAHLIVAMHVPPETMLVRPHGTRLDYEEQSRQLLAVLSRHGVDAVLCSHEHMHHVEDWNGILLVVSGGAGAPLAPFQKYGYYRIDVENGTVRETFLPIKPRK